MFRLAATETRRRPPRIVSRTRYGHETTQKQGIRSRVVSMPSWELFDEQPAE